MTSTSTPSQPPSFPSRPYTPPNPRGPFPYTPTSLTPQDTSNDATFYDAPRFVTHIDDNAISTLSQYYALTLPKRGVILDVCSSWISHYPRDVSKGGAVTVLGTGMNAQELRRNSALRGWSVRDLNREPEIAVPKVDGDGSRPGGGGGDDGGVEKIDAATCVVSIDYLTKPVEVLASLRSVTKPGGAVHLVVSNRCFPTKVVRRWLEVDEKARLEMVGDYLWWSGWRDIEILTLVEGSWLKDPLWVVRGKNINEDDVTQ